MGPGRISIFRKLWPGSLGSTHYVFAAVFLVRLVILIHLASSPLLLPSGSDMQFYDEWAKQILQGHWTDHQAFYGLPLYPFLLAFLYGLFGYGPFVPGLFQAALDAGTAVLIYKITLEIMTRNRVEKVRVANRAGIAAAAGWCFFVPAQAYSAILMPAAGAVFVFWLLVWQLVRHEAGVPVRRSFAYGLLVGASAMAVATILFLIPLVICAILIRVKRLAARSAAIGLLFTGVFAGTAPCWIHNYCVARDRVFLSAHGGINLWLGNNPEANGYPRFPGMHAGQGQMLRDSIDQAEIAAGRTLRRSEVSQYWSSKARDYIAANPGAWLRLLVRKTGNFWNAFEYDDVGVITNLRDHGIIFPGLHFAVVAAVGLAGIIFCWQGYPASRWVAAAVLLQMAAILPVFVTERYRLAAVPGLLVLDVLGLRQLWKRFSTGRYTGVAAQLGALAASAWLVSLPRPDPSLWALDAYNSGKLALETNNLAVAEQHLQRAYALVPKNAEINFALGNLRLVQGNTAGAKSFYRATLQADNTHKGALNNLGVLALEERQWKMAIKFFQASVQSDPAEAKTHYLLARAELENGDVITALSEIQIALRRQPEQPQFRALFDAIRARQ